MKLCKHCKKLIPEKKKGKKKEYCNDLCRMRFHNSFIELVAIYRATDACLVCEKPFTDKEKRRGKRTCSNTCRSINHKRKHDQTTSP